MQARYLEIGATDKGKPIYWKVDSFNYGTFEFGGGGALPDALKGTWFQGKAVNAVKKYLGNYKEVDSEKEATKGRAFVYNNPVPIYEGETRQSVNIPAKKSVRKRNDDKVEKKKTKAKSKSKPKAKSKAKAASNG